MIRNAAFYSLVMELHNKGKLMEMSLEKMKARQRDTEIRATQAADIKAKEKEAEKCI